MADYSKRVVIRAQRIHYLGCCSGCFIPVFVVVAFSIRALLGLNGRFSIAILGIGIAILLIVAVAILWFFFNDIRIARVWNQKFVFDRDSFHFRDDKIEQELAYKQIESVRVEQIPPGPSHDIIFQCRNSQPEIIKCIAHDFSPEAVMKILTQLSHRAGLVSIEISRLPDADNEKDLRSAAKRLGEISVDESKNCFLFTPIRS